jgi:hypothetical protein
MAACACECGGETAGGIFLPGHDQRLRASVERKAGGLLNLARIVTLAEQYTDGHLSLNEFGTVVRQLLPRTEP